MRNARRLFMTVGTGESADPMRIGANDLQPGAYLFSTHLGSRCLTFKIGAETKTVNSGLKNSAKFLGLCRTLFRRQLCLQFGCRELQGISRCPVREVLRVGRCGYRHLCSFSF